jgi:hypothetical protein
MHYLHQHALWTQAWTIFGVVERMCSPLGLYHERCPQEFHKFKEPRHGFQDPPEDAIDRIEQQNLLWYFIASDTMASTGSGWPAAFDPDNVTHGLPICHASQASSVCSLPSPPPSTICELTLQPPYSPVFSVDSLPDPIPALTEPLYRPPRSSRQLLHARLQGHCPCPQGHRFYAGGRPERGKRSEGRERFPGVGWVVKGFLVGLLQSLSKGEMDRREKRADCTDTDALRYSSFLQGFVAQERRNHRWSLARWFLGRWYVSNDLLECFL